MLVEGAFYFSAGPVKTSQRGVPGGNKNTGRPAEKTYLLCTKSQTEDAAPKVWPATLEQTWPCDSVVIVLNILEDIWDALNFIIFGT